MVVATAPVREMIKQELAEGRLLDPEKITTKIIGRLSQDDIDAMIRAGVSCAVMDEVRLLRKGRMPTKGASWHGRHVRRISIDDLGDRISLGDEAWIWVEDCTAETLQTYAALQRTRAQGFLRAAQAADDLAANLLDGRCETVKDLYALKAKVAA